MTENQQEPPSMVFRRAIKSARAADFENWLRELGLALLQFEGYLGLDGHLIEMSQLLGAN
jgi:antibiotic biosynthesis monooxygenase (ABM) superfamily enzyme